MLSYDPCNNNATPQPEPLFALTFHGVKEGLSKQALIDGVTLHRIEKHIIGEGKYVDAHEVKKWINTCAIANNSEKSHGFINARCIAETNTHFCFYEPSFVGRMWFRVTKPIGLRVTYPAMLYITHKQNRTLNVVALDSDDRPTLESKVYHAPLMNISQNSSLCIGSATLPDIRNENTISDIVKCLIESNFTHVNSTKTLSQKWCQKNSKQSATTNDLLEYWQKRGIRKPAKQDLHFKSSLHDYLIGIMNND